MTSLLWMDEDELRQTCWVLLRCLARSQQEVKAVHRAVADGYKQGYGDGLADAALQVSYEAKARDAESLSLH